MTLLDHLHALPLAQRIVAIVALMLLLHLLVRGIRALGERILAPGGGRDDRERLLRLHPKVITFSSVVVGALVFAIYFAGIGFVLAEIGLSLRAYLASATVIGLAVGFGSQGLVQDVVIGLTVISSDVLHVGDVVDISGQTGRVERIGLRFTVLVNALDQRVFIPNRSINQINRYPAGYVHAAVDFQVPTGMDDGQLRALLMGAATGVRRQHPAVIVADPEWRGIEDTGSWRYARLGFRIWPGQGALLEQAFVRRAVASLRALAPDYQEWMAGISYRTER
jgi:moderate conductance mechanosensitive channel